MHFLRIYFLSFCCCLLSVVSAQQPCPDIIISGEVIHENPCGNGPNGSIHITIDGGVEPYSITWTSSQTDQDSIIDLTSGTYGVTVIDSNNCMAVAGFQVLLVDTMTFEDLSIYPSCDGDSGTGVISVLGGNPPYSYLWSNGSTDSVAYNLALGQHSVTVTDQSNCTVIMEVEIITNLELEVFPVVNHPLCFSDFGDVSLFILGGAPPYNIDWMGIDSTAVTPGSYDVEVSDASNCSKVVSYHILSEEAIVVDLDTFLLDCVGNQFAVNTHISGGTAPYELNWFGLDTNSVFSGIHHFEVIDSLGCIYQDSLVIDQVDSLTINVFSEVLECSQDSTLANIEIAGGISPYEIVWSGTSSDSLVSYVFEGMNWVEIVDARGCVIRDSFEVVSPTDLLVEFEITPSTCNAQNGSLITHVTGGSGQFSILFSGSVIDTILTGLSEGEYSFQIVDYNGCEIDTTVFLPSLPHFYLSSFEQINNGCHGESLASLELNFEGVEGELELFWNTGDTTTTIDSLSAGVYTLSAMDSTGCLFDTVFVIEDVDPVFFTTYIQYNPCESILDKFITISPGGGTPPYIIDWESGSSSDSTFYIDEIGSYYVEVTDSNGCTTAMSLLVEGDNVGGEFCFKIPNAFSPNGDGSNDTWIITGLDEKPNNSLKVFNRWGLVVFESSNYQSDWNGTNGSSELPMGSYYYTLDLGDGKHIFDGTISIKR